MKWSCGFWLHPSFLKKHQWVSFVYFVLWEGVSCNLNWLKTLQVDEAALKVLIFLPSTSKVLELEACIHTRPSNPFYVLLPGHRRMQFWVLYLKELMGGHMTWEMKQGDQKFSHPHLHSQPGMAGAAGDPRSRQTNKQTGKEELKFPLTT
jgi:hypothetical protein